MEWEVKYLKEAEKDLMSLDHSQQLQVLKAIYKVSKNPLSSIEGGYGKALGNKNNVNLTGYYKIKLKALGLRVVYGLIREKGIMKIIVISIRDDEMVYKIATDRIRH
ncbi:type II toxin-antitoxin system RelE/ParE family toxin [Clostridium sp.]|uniref:type II toxin-antitoxin system RelE family toxin n=1 Tax=Clostridium sp. TaxID=1506 RepID=UPI00261849AE|nr:type II toxin-antitoxin system RelE/ParE family toxin [Clostridium sp.]